MTDNELILLAVRSNDLDTVRRFVEKDANIYLDDLLADASYYGHLDVIKYFVAQGANMHAQDDLALRYATHSGHMNIVKYLVLHGANIHAHNDRVLSDASNNGHYDIYRYLKDEMAGKNIVKNVVSIPTESMVFIEL